MKEYHKIITVYSRDPETKYRTLIEGQYATPELEFLANCRWVWTEKIDGTNIRIIWDGTRVRFGGKTDNAQIPAFLLEALQDYFTPESMQANCSGPITLYGEGFGNKIQKAGKLYLPDRCDFILFDAFAGGMWLERSSITRIGALFGVAVVPEVGAGTLVEAVNAAKHGFPSTIGEAQSEGLIMRPPIELLDRQGNRVITKIKARDFK